jgi:hypothetical protein
LFTSSTSQGLLQGISTPLKREGQRTDEVASSSFSHSGPSWPSVALAITRCIAAPSVYSVLFGMRLSLLGGVLGSFLVHQSLRPCAPSHVSDRFSPTVFSGPRLYDTYLRSTRYTHQFPSTWAAHFLARFRGLLVSCLPGRPLSLERLMSIFGYPKGGIVVT